MGAVKRHPFVDRIASMRVRDWVLLAALSFALSLAGLLGTSYGLSAPQGFAVIPLPWCLGLSFAVMVPVAFVFLVVDAALAKVARISLEHDAAREATPTAQADGEEERTDPGAAKLRTSRLARFVPVLTAKSVALFAAIMIVFWSPYVIAAFPGQLYNDTAVQMQQVYPDAHPLELRSGGNSPLNAELVEEARKQYSEEVMREQDFFVTDAWLVDHHPFALTLIVGGLAMASDALFGNWMPALGLIVGVLMVVMAAELTCCMAYLRRKGAPLGLCLAGYLFCCLVPFVPIYATMAVKDTFFSLCFIPWFLMLIECVLTKGAFLCRARSAAAFTAVAVLMCFMKKTGVYVVGATALFGLIVALVAWRRARRAGEDASARRRPRAAALAFFAQGGICALLMFVLVPLLLFPALNIQPASKGESLGLLFQQTARVYHDEGAEALTPEEREAVRGVLRENELGEDYAYTVTDRVKRHYYPDSTDQQFSDYLHAYASMGVRYPEAYLSSVLSVISGFLAPVRVNVFVAETFGWELIFDDFRPVIWPLEENASLRDALNAFLDAWGSIPVLNLPLCVVVYCLWIPVLLLFFCARNRLKAGLLFVPFVVVTGFCLIGPVFDSRYALPEILLAPTLVGACVAQAKAVFRARAEKSRALSGAPASEEQDGAAKVAVEDAPKEAPTQA